MLVIFLSLNILVNDTFIWIYFTEKTSNDTPNDPVFCVVLLHESTYDRGDVEATKVGC